MVYDYDVAVIGAGLLGCFTARSLSRYKGKIGVFERASDVCTGISKANTAIIYPGYDTKPGSLKARLCIAANRNLEALCRDLNVRFRRTGSLMVSFGPRGDKVIRDKLTQGNSMGIGGLRLLSAPEVLEMEPNINPSVTGALYAETTSTLNPWELGLAAAECAAGNGVEFRFNSEVTSIHPIEGGYLLVTREGNYSARAIVNCAGLSADRVSEMLNRPHLRIKPTAADYIVLDPSVGGYIRHIIMHEPEIKGKGATIVPTVDGNILVGPSDVKRDNRDGFETGREGLDFVRSAAGFVFPGLPLNLAIRSFASTRPGTAAVAIDDAGGIYETGESIPGLSIIESDEHRGFISLIGIKTPGLTCCAEIGDHVAGMLLETLGNPGENYDYSPQAPRHIRMSELGLDEQAAAASANPAYGKIVCRCMKVTEGEIRDAVRRSPGAVSLDGVKRRTGAQMGRCQGGFCTQRIIEIIAEELGRSVSEIRKDAPGSVMICKE